MNDDQLDALFAALRAEALPAESSARVRARLFAGGERRRLRRLVLAAVLLLAIGSASLAGIVHWWVVRLDVQHRTVQGGKLVRTWIDEQGANWAELELPDGRRVEVRLPDGGQGERRVEVELPAHEEEERR